jgi:hypothetical protein
MHFVGLLLALFVANGPANAQSWKEYAYPDHAFAVAFPAEPVTETVPHRAPDGRSLSAG